MDFGHNCSTIKWLVKTITSSCQIAQRPAILQDTAVHNTHNGKYKIQYYPCLKENFLYNFENYSLEDFIKLLLG